MVLRVNVLIVDTLSTTACITLVVLYSRNSDAGLRQTGPIPRLWQLTGLSGQRISSTLPETATDARTHLILKVPIVGPDSNINHQDINL